MAPVIIRLDKELIGGLKNSRKNNDVEQRRPLCSNFRPFANESNKLKVSQET